MHLMCRIVSYLLCKSIGYNTFSFLSLQKCTELDVFRAQDSAQVSKIAGMESTISHLKSLIVAHTILYSTCNMVC